MRIKKWINKIDLYVFFIQKLNELINKNWVLSEKQVEKYGIFKNKWKIRDLHEKLEGFENFQFLKIFKVQPSIWKNGKEKTLFRCSKCKYSVWE